MDLDVLAKNAQTILSFKGELETLLPQLRKAVSDAVTVTGEVEGVRELLMPALSKIEEMKPDLEALASDISQIKETLGPALAWIDAQQKAIEVAKAEAKPAVPPEPDKPLEHVAEAIVNEVPVQTAEVAERSESEHAAN